MARILVVGGGLIGGHTALRLAARGDEVTVLSRSFSPWLLSQRAEESRAIELVEGSLPLSLAESDAVSSLFCDRDAVYCFAGLSTPALAAREPANSAVSTIIPVLTTLERARQEGVRRVVFASSGGTVYGQASTFPTSEAEGASPISLHGVNALAAELYGSFFERIHGLDVVILRFSNVYGPGQRMRRGQGVIAAWCEALVRGESPVMIGDGSERRDFVYGSDAASAAEAALSAPAGIFNIGAGTAIRLSELLATLREVTGVEFEAVSRPARGVDLPAVELDATSFRESTGWQPEVDLRQGLSATWAWVTRSSARSPGGPAT